MHKTRSNSRQIVIMAADVTPDATACIVDDCVNDADPDAPFPICLFHVRDAFAYYAVHAADATQPRETSRIKPVLRKSEKIGRVYFIRRGDLIKIGWSQDVDRRIKQLDGDALLHDQPGTMHDEHLLHEAFADLLEPSLGREWFHEAPKLTAFIALLHNEAA